MDKKKVFGILIFIIMAIFMFTFTYVSEKRMEILNKNRDPSLYPLYGDNENDDEFGIDDKELDEDKDSEKDTNDDIDEDTEKDEENKVDTGKTEEDESHVQYEKPTQSTTDNFAGESNKTEKPVVNKKERVKVVWTKVSHTYNGKVKKPSAYFINSSGVKIPLKVTGSGTNVGTYTAKAISDNSNYIITNTSTSFRIKPKVLTNSDISNISFKDKTVNYDGNNHGIVINGSLPNGAKVKYSPKAQVNAGVYEITATITGSGNYTGSLTKKAKLTINKKEVATNWEDLEFIYDGTSKMPKAHFLDIEGNKVMLNVSGYKIDAGTHTATATNTHSNYIITNNTKVFKINPKVLEESDIVGITLEDKTVEYNGEKQNLAITGILPDGFIVEYTPEDNINVGEYDINAKIIAGGNYTGSLNKTAKLTIIEKTIIIDWSNLEFTYDGTAKKPSATYTTDNGDTIELTVSGSGINAGTYTATASGANYNITNNTKEYIIYPKTLEESDITGITFEDKVVEYSGSPHSIEISGILPSGFTVEYSPENATDLGTYTITATINGAGNYTGSIIKTAELMITEKIITIDWSNLEFTYDGNSKKPKATYVDDNGDSIELSVSGSAINVGIHTATATDANYIITNNTKEFKINPKVLEESDIVGITFEDKTVEYNGEKQNLAITGILPDGFTVEYTPEDNINVGEYDINAKIIAGGNYTGSLNKTAKLTIIEKTIIIDWSNLEFTYDGSSKKPSATYTTDNGDTVEFTVSGSGINAGTYTATASGANYNITNNTKEYIIYPKTLEESDITGITFEDKVVEYSGSPHSIEISGILPSGFTVEYSPENATDLGTYTITAIINGAGNYTGSLIKTAELTINKRKINVVWDDLEFTYDGNSKKPSATSVEGYEIIVSGEETDAGTYTATATIVDDYSVLTNPTTSFTINPKVLEEADLPDITFEDYAIEYDGNSHSIEISGTLPSGFTVEYTPEHRTNAGEHTMTAKISGTGNYTGSITKTAILTIYKELIDVVWDNLEFTYDGSAKKPSATNVDGIEIIVSGEETDAGTYTATASTVSSNYTITNNTKEFKINPKVLEESDITGVSFEDKTVVFNGNEQGLTITGSLPSGFTVSYTPEDNVNVGEYEITANITGGGNYTGSLTKTAILTIAKKEVETIWTDTEITYDGTSKMPKAHFVDIDGDIVILDVSGYQINVGTYEATASNVYTNYTITNETTSFTISPKILEESDISGITFEDKTIEYDGNNHRIKINGTLPDGITVEYIPEYKHEIGVYEMTAKFMGSGNYSGELEKIAILTIAKKTLIINWSDLEFTYDGTEKSPTASLDGYTITVSGSGTNAGTYEATATVDDENSTISNDTVSFTINPKTLEESDISGITFEDKEVDFDGEDHSIEISGTLPDGVSVSYSPASAYIAGVHVITATFTGYDNYTGTLEKTAELTITGQELESMILTVRTTSPNETVTLPISNSTGLTINWDERSDSENFEDPNKSANPTYTYDTPGEYEVHINGEAEANASFGTNNRNYINPHIVGLGQWGENGYRQIFSFGRNLEGNIPIPAEKSFKNIVSLAYVFYGSDGLTGSIPEELFANAPNVTSFNSSFYGCTGLTGSIPANLFANNPNITSFSGTFTDCSGLTGSIPEELFANNNKTSSFQATFSGCSGLSGSIPENLFANNPDVTAFNNTFYRCSGLTGSIPANLFASSSKANTYQSTFQGCSGLTGSIPEDLFSASEIITSFYQVFQDCSGLTGSIPVGLFANSPELLNLWGTFKGCSSLTGPIPAGLFDNNPLVNSYISTFEGCSSLTGPIPAGLFDGKELVTTFANTFKDCSSITGPIPSGLFKDSSINTTFAGTFQGCESLTGSIPAGLFDSSDNITSFQYTFLGCKNLSGAIPEGLFDVVVNATSFYQTFNGCSSLTEIPEGLFDNNTLVTTFYRAFLNCTSLTGNAPELWNIPEVAGNQCFRSCTLLENYDSIPAGWK